MGGALAGTAGSGGGLALLQPLAVTRVMKALNLVMKSPGEKPARNYFKIAFV